MAELTTTIHIADIEEVKATLECSVKLVEAIKECNFNTNPGFPNELTIPYRNLVSAMNDLKIVK